MSYVEEKIDRFQDYLANVQQSNNAELVLYRGQNVDEPLLPGIARMDVGPTHTWARQYEQPMLDEFKRYAVGLIPERPRNEDDWNWLALAQHHRLATRFLDWTESPLAALWFAVCESPTPQRTESSGVVWRLTIRPEKIVRPPQPHPFCISENVVFRPDHVTSRIRVQAGWFTVHRFVQEKQRFAAVEEEAPYSSGLMKLKIPVGKFYEYRQELNKLGLNQFALFPDIDGLSSHIRWKFTQPGAWSKYVKSSNADPIGA